MQSRTADNSVTYVYAYLQFFVPKYDFFKNTLVKHCVVKTKFHYARWFDAGSELVLRWFELKFGLSSMVRGQIPLRYLVRSWLEAGRRPA